MSSQDLTTQGLIDTIRLLAAIPDNAQLNADDARLIDLLNFELSNSLVPQFMATKAEFFVKDYDFQTYVKDDGVWQDTFELPANSVGMVLRDLVQLTSNNSQTPPQESFIPQITPEDVAGLRFSASYSGNGGLSCYMKGNNVVLFPCPTQVLTLRMKYFRQPAYLVSVADAGQVLSIDTNANTVVLSNLPSDWSTSDTVDSIQSYQGFDYNANDVQITSISNPTLGLSDVTGIQVGDWVALSGDSPIPQLPICAQAVLVQAVVIKLLESLKDVEGVKIAQAKYNELYKAMEFMIQPRIQGEPLKITGGGRSLSDYMRGRRGWSGYRS